MSTEQLSFCRICAAACGIVVTVEGERVVRVTGDGDHPVSRGYVCSKGRGLPEWHHSARRLDHPVVRGRRAEWVTALDDLADRMRTTIAAHGPDAVALYLATGMAYDSAGQVAVGRWMGTIGSGSFYTAATVDNAPVLVAAELVAGNAMLNPVWDPSSPGLLVLVGTNPVVSHGYGTTLADPVRRLREFRSSGGRIVVIDPRRTESAALADEHLGVIPGSDVVLLAALARLLLAEGVDPTELCRAEDLHSLREVLESFSVERAAAATGLTAGVIASLGAAIIANRGRVAMMCGTGTTMATDGVVTEWLRWVLLVLSGSLDRPGGMRFNYGLVNRLRPPRAAAAGSQLRAVASRPDLRRVVGQVPAIALADEIEAGHVRALVVTGGNPLTALPEPDRVRRALRSLDTLAVVDVIDNELVGMATHVLPATGQLERADLTLAEHVAFRSGLQSTRPVVAPVGERRPAWWIMQALGRRLDAIVPDPTGAGGPAGEPPGAVSDEMVLRGLLGHSPVDADTVWAAGPRGVDAPAEFGRVRAEMLPGGVWNVAPPEMLQRLRDHVAGAVETIVLTPRRDMAWSNSVRYGRQRGALADAAVLRIHVDDASAAGVAAGQAVEVSSAHGAITAVVTIDPNTRAGVASLTHGRRESNVGALTSSSDGVDPLTAMPHASGLPVTIRRPSAARPE